MYLVKTPKFIQNLFPNFTWTIPTQDNQIYLTFDDGPIPDVTPWVLQQLEMYHAKATFFCVGENVNTNSDIFEMVKQGGHAIGNHTFNHINGWSTENIPYFHNVRHCAHVVDSVLFRPPYGRLRPKQIQFLQRHYRIIMWDVLSGDFDPKISAEQCFNNVKSNATAGSIIVFHDSLKAQDKLTYVLPRVLEYFSGLGYTFEKLNDQSISTQNSLRQSA